MIIVGYPCIGKSTISGGKNIDLDDSDMRFPLRGVSEKPHLIRPEGWEQCYINVAVSLSLQGFNVFVSSRPEVVEELRRRGLKFMAIYPSGELKCRWVERCAKCYESNPSEDNEKKLQRVTRCFDEETRALAESTPYQYIIESDKYDLNELVKDFMEWQEKEN
jgi:hypothetical protein